MWSAIEGRSLRMMWHGGNWLGGSIVMTVAMVVFWLVLVTAVVFTVRYIRSVTPSGTGSALAAAAGPSSAESLLAERFARGEIDDDEYQRKLMLLHQHR
ncbi:SHOCT domain-containing protein [Mycobacterium intracellulare subsp. intracellulare]|nr:SHOCT domain-containing protein [Mycobacterium intracellulare subsp. intracellulare]MDS0337968.1 SHOCT domain-containing protein [Mycobacterium intracellulare]